jgi:hypothetical protein
MNIRQSIFSTIAALGMAAALAAPAAIASPPSESDSGNNQTDAVVEITEGGTFDAYFCSVTLSPFAMDPASQNTLTQQTPPTAHTAGLATGQLFICYDDTLSYRPAFDVQVQAGQFTSSNASQQTPISASNFKVTKTYNTGQQHWSGPTDGHGHVPHIGDTGSFGENGYVGQNTLPVVWPGPDNTLDVARNVQFGYNGIGTGWSVGYFDVELTIPGGTAPGDYSSEVTLTIITGTQTK